MASQLTIKQRNEKLPMRIYRKSILIVVLLLAWTILPNYFPTMYMPPFGKILGEFRYQIVKGYFAANLYASLHVSIIGLVISEAVGIPLGALLGWYKRVERFLDPLLQLMRATSVLALLPIFVLFLGIGDVSKVAIVIWATIFPTLINTAQGVRNADPVLVRSAQSMGISKVGLFFKVILPAASPYILVGLRISASISLLVVIAAEMIGAVAGIGYSINTASRIFRVNEMYVYVITMAVLGTTLNAVLMALERRLLCWQDKSLRERE
ncbi:MAG: ABC transporter permease [Clostridiales Family XIII bacterium]|jgi:NitT/TauT family transport system permease protein|nr:ABC transporter permease [Clostridiales Family XIII bacterium]